MNIPQWILLTLILISLGIKIQEHNRILIRKGDGVSAFISAMLELSLLYWGGFFDCWLK